MDDTFGVIIREADEACSLDGRALTKKFLDYAEGDVAVEQFNTAGVTDYLGANKTVVQSAGLRESVELFPYIPLIQMGDDASEPEHAWGLHDAVNGFHGLVGNLYLSGSGACHLDGAGGVIKILEIVKLQCFAEPDSAVANQEENQEQSLSAASLGL